MGLLSPLLSLSASPRTMITTILLAILTAILSRILYMQFLHPLSRFPGPWYATSFSIFNAILSVYKLEHKFLLYTAQKYERRNHTGPIRIAPNMLLFPNPAALKEIYWDARLNTKAGIYGSGALGPPLHLFDTIDGDDHKALRKALSNAPWTIGQLKKHWEPRFDAQVRLFIAQMRAHASSRNIICLSDKVAEFAADIMSMVSFGAAFGCVRNQRDEKRILENWRKGLPLFGLITRWRFLRDVLLRYRLVARMLLPNVGKEEGMGWLMAEADRQVTQREELRKEIREMGDMDFLQYCLDARLPNNTPLSPSQKRAHVTLLIQAGADTTGTALGSTLGFLLQRPVSLARCLSEIRTADSAGHLSSPIQFEETRQHLPYFSACIKEFLRLHPPATNVFARLCPPEGKIVDGVFVPPGTEVTAHAYTVHRNKAFFGDDAEQYRPERWLEDGDKRKKSAAELEAGLFYWGMGFRVCIGKDIAMMELCKLLPEFLRRFDIELVEPGEYVVAGGIAWNEGLLGRLREREGMEAAL